MFHRESGYYKSTYEGDQSLYPLPIARWTIATIAIIFFVIAPTFGSEYLLTICNLVGIAIVGALGLNILIGLSGQISIGHAAFMSVGAYTAANLATRLDMPFWITLPAGGLMAAFIGVIVGFPSVRIKGLYLAISTLAAQFIIDWVIIHTPSISGGFSASIQVPRPVIFGHQLETQHELYLFILVVAAIAIVASLNIARSRIGRAFIAIRDQDIAAEIIGIDVRRYKLTAFAISSFYAGVAGVLYVYYSGVANNEFFPLVVSIDYLAMVIIGGMGSVLGAIFGAVFVTLLPIGIDQFMSAIGPYFFEDQGVLAGVKSHLRLIIFGGLIMFFLVVEPEGLNRLWLNIRNYFRIWPFSY
jgi:branched-chain amino acid transport system permease protein